MDDNQVETINDIHNYLTTFTKEIQSVPQQASKNVAHVYVDESGHYFYQPLGTSEIVIMDEDNKADVKQLKKSSLSLDAKYSQLDCIIEAETDLGCESPNENGHSSVQTLPSNNRTGDSNNILVGGGNQLLTLLPSCNNETMNYVFIVEQSDDQCRDDAIYEFNETDDSISYVGKESIEEQNKKVIRFIPKRSQTINPVHMCNYCNYTTPKRYLLARHMRSHSEERPYKCSECDRGFKTLPSLQNHVNTHTGTKPHQCKCCSSQFTTSGELVRHVRYKHTHEKPHKCPECDYASVELSKLKRHVRCHTGERPYQCPHCTYASPDSFKLKRHLRIHTGEKPYECDVCNARFTQSNSLKAHKLIHTGNKPVYACELCPTTCGRKTDLRIHVQKLHTSEKPLKCPKCAKSFPDRYTFKVHSKSHDGEKCFKCDLCSYASSSVRHLESHMLIHTEQKPFRCTECDQAFRQKPLLKRHHNVFHNPLYIPPAPKVKTQVCKICRRMFRHKGYLMRHMASHEASVDPYQKEDSSPDSKQKRQRLHSLPSSQMSMYNAEGDEVMTVQGNDGNQYVFLEVIQLPDGENHVMMSGALNCSEESSLEASNILSPSLMVPDTELLELEEQSKKTTLKIEILESDKKDEQKGMESCFGFDDEDESSQINLQFSS